MANKSFTSTIKSEEKSESTITQSHSFTSSITNSRFYEIIFTGFTTSLSWFITFTQRIPVTINTIKSIIKPHITIVIRESTIINRTLVNLKILPHIVVASSFTITVLEKLFQKLGAVTVTAQNNIIATLKQKVNIKSVPTISSRIQLIVNPTFSKYYLLSYWDTYDLTDMNELDAMNVSSMDYQIV